MKTLAIEFGKNVPKFCLKYIDTQTNVLYNLFANNYSRTNYCEQSFLFIVIKNGGKLSWGLENTKNQTIK